MKIALVNINYTKQGGTEIYMIDLAKFLVKKGHEIHVITSNIDTDCKLDEINYHIVPGWGKHLGIDKYIFANNAKKEVKKYDFDIVQTFSRTGFGDVIIIGGGCHQNFLDKYLGSLENPFYKLKKKIEYKLSLKDYFTRYYEAKDFKKGNYKKIIAVSKMVKDEIIEKYEVPENDIIVNHNGVDINYFHPQNKNKFRDSIRNKHGITDNDFTILFLGTGFKRKGLIYILRALKLLKDVKLLVVGNGDVKKFKKISQDLDVIDQVTFVGAVNNVEAYYAASDAFVFPTIYEPFGLVVTEAMASGIPVITSEVAGAAEIIDHKKDGLLLKTPDNIEKLKEYINYLKNNDDKKNEMSKAARLKAKEFTQKKNHENVIDIYKKLIKE